MGERDSICSAQVAADRDRYGFLTDARMKEAGDFFIRKALRQPFFNPPNAQHLGVTLGECGHAAGVSLAA